MASFDRRKCKGPLNGPNATGQHCAEGWTFYTEPLPQMKGVTTSGSAESSYYTWVDQFDTLGLGANTPINTGNHSEGLLALKDGKWVVLRVPYPTGFYTKWMDGRIDDPNGRLEGPRAVGDGLDARAVPYGNRQGHDEQGGALPDASRSAGEVTTTTVDRRARAVADKLTGLCGLYVGRVLADPPCSFSRRIHVRLIRVLPFAAAAVICACSSTARAGIDGAEGAAVRQPRRLSPRHHDGFPGRAEVFRSGADAFLRVQSRRSDSGVQAGHRARSRMRDVLLGRGVRVRAEHQRADHRGRREGGVPAIEQARMHAAGATDKERAYIDALAKRYAADPKAERAPLDRAYADAMREVVKRFPDDLDAATLFAQSLMDTSPWNYWEQDGSPRAVHERGDRRRSSRCSRARTTTPARFICTFTPSRRRPTRAAPRSTPTSWRRSCRAPVTSCTCRDTSICGPAATTTRRRPTSTPSRPTKRTSPAMRWRAT